MSRARDQAHEASSRLAEQAPRREALKLAVELTCGLAGIGAMPAVLGSLQATMSGEQPAAAALPSNESVVSMARDFAKFLADG